MSDQPREYTVDEVRDMFMDHVRNMITYWQKAPYREEFHHLNESESDWRVSGVVHSILCALDGCSMNLPGFILAPAPHPDDREYNKTNNCNWFPENNIPINCDIGGYLHELLYQPSK